MEPWGRTRARAVRLTGAVATAAVCATLVVVTPARASTMRLVPEQYATIASAIAAASAGDVIDVAPGLYVGGVSVNKSVTVRGRIYDPADPRTNTTILDGGGTVPAITVPAGVTPGPTIVGLVLRNGSDGARVSSVATLQHNWFVSNVDHIDYALGAGGLCRDNVFENSADDSVDIDHLTRSLTVENNLMLNSQDDGIEMRLHDDVFATTAVATFRGNTIVGSRGDGIQIIDYYTLTNRRIIIERNLIRDNLRAGIGLLDNEVTVEDYRAASILERIEVFHNTLVRNNHGISGGDNLIALNNVFLTHTLAMKNIDGGSIASRNLFWNNTTNTLGSNVEQSTVADPLLDAAYVPSDSSPAVDAGWTQFSWGGQVVLDQAPDTYAGSAPDLGWKETSPANAAPSVDAGPDQTVVLPAGATVAGSVFDDGLPPPASLSTVWSQQSAQGVATIANPAAAQTTVTFDSAGTYVLRLTASDGALSAFDDVTITVLPPNPDNRPPEVTSASISPTGPRTNDLLSANVVASDPDGDPVTLSYRWIRNGSDLVAATGSTLDLAVAGHGDAGDAIAVTVIASDGQTNSPPAMSATVTVLDSPPSFLQDLPDRSDAEGSVIDLSAGATDPDGDPIAYSAAGLPPGLSIGGSTGRITGVVAAGAAGSHAVTVTLYQGGAAGPSDTFTWSVTPAPQPAITFRGASTNSVKSRASVLVGAPAGLAAGDVLLACVLVRGTGTVSAPAGWALVRADVSGTSVRQVVYVRVAAASDVSYRFTFSAESRASAVVVAYAGVSTSGPIVASGGQDATSTATITAPSVSNSVAGAGLVGFFGVLSPAVSSIAPPGGMDERAEIASPARPKTVLEVADSMSTAVGDTGIRTAVSTLAGPAIGQLVLLRPVP